MSEKNLKSRIIHKHDTSENWAKATNFIPKQGEIIVYDKDSTYSYERFKIGDGITNINSLPFADDQKADKALVGDISVANQINNAITSKQDVLTAGHNITIEDNVISAVNELPEITGVSDGTKYACISGVGFSDMCYGANIWVGTNPEGISYSTDGKNWTNAIIDTVCYCVRYYNNMFVVSGYNSDSGYVVYYSTDGMVWDAGSFVNGTAAAKLNDICYNNNAFIASTINGIYRSTNGISWKLAYEVESIGCIHCENNICIANFGDTGLYYSIDGITWTQSNITSGSFNIIEYGDGIWIAGDSSGVLYCSNDGISWEVSYDMGGNIGMIKFLNHNWLVSIYYYPDMFELIYSSNAESWKRYSKLNGIGFFNACYNDGVYVICGTSGIYYSTDFQNWTCSDASVIGDIIYANNMWLVYRYDWDSGDKYLWISTISSYGKCLCVDADGEWGLQSPIQPISVAELNELLADPV